MTFIDPSAKPLSSGYQIQQSLIAIGSGEVFGKGFGQSIQKFNYLPEPVGDSVFAVVAEELGFVGASILILLFVAFAARGLAIAADAANAFGAFAATGLTLVIALSAFLNIGAMLGVLPLTGLPLPFISHGGSALLAALASVGIILNVAAHRKRPQGDVDDERLYTICMKVVFTGGGTGGHFYPAIAMAEAVRDLAREPRLIEPRPYYFAPTPADEDVLFENGIVFIRIPAGKMRRYRSFKNITDLLATGTGFLMALSALFRIFPDVVVSKGGYGSVPTVLAARLLGIPIIIHESDAKPGRANLLAAPFATRIAIAFPSAAAYFPKSARGKIAQTGIPIRH